MIISRLLTEPELQARGMEQLIHDYILLTIQLTVDEIENIFEKLSGNISLAKVPDRGDIEKKLEELQTFFILP